MKLCRNCNVTYDDEELCFCYKCGSRLENVNICPKCFTENGLDFAFCVKCGTKLNGNSNTTSASVTGPSIKSKEKPKSITSNVNEYQYNTTQRDTDSSGVFGNPVTLIMMIVLAIVILTVLAMR